MRILLTILLLTPTLISTAQEWCTPGAKWSYQIDGWFIQTQDTYTYLADTFYEGRMAQKIQVHSLGTLLGSIPPEEVDEIWTEFTAVEDGIVWIWKTYGGTPSWDTLYWFGAQVGDRWWPIAHPLECPPFGMLEVVSTGSMELQGVELATVTVVIINEDGEPYSLPFTITERIGSIPRIVPSYFCNLIIEYPFIPGACYADQEIEFSLGGLDCTLTVNVEQENDRVDKPTLHPNPGTTFQLTGIGQSPALMRMLDVQGRTVHEGLFVTEHSMVDIPGLNAGTYLVHLQFSDGRREVLRWTKE
ncbi:MAG: T9SS type A sorting domain-containing protein [Flavobacteriales bacterium]|nr:T9SS type A sorting domain-containing protein [Flavobacteriales bacterium]